MLEAALLRLGHQDAADLMGSRVAPSTHVWPGCDGQEGPNPCLHAPVLPQLSLQGWACIPIHPRSIQFASLCPTPLPWGVSQPPNQVCWHLGGCKAASASISW